MILLGLNSLCGVKRWRESDCYQVYVLSNLHVRAESPFAPICTPKLMWTYFQFVMLRETPSPPGVGRSVEVRVCSSELRLPGHCYQVGAEAIEVVERQSTNFVGKWGHLRALLRRLNNLLVDLLVCGGNHQLRLFSIFPVFLVLLGK